MNYIYLDKEEAKKGNSLVFAVCNEPIKDYEDYFDETVVEFVGRDLPHYITYIEESNSIREATEEEKLERGQRTLQAGEILLNNKIISYDPHFEKLVDGRIVKRTRKDFIEDGYITLEGEREKARARRSEEFKVLDIYDKAVLRGDIIEGDTDRIIRDRFRSEWLEVPSKYIDIFIPVETFYPKMPKLIKYFK